MASSARKNWLCRRSARLGLVALLATVAAALLLVAAPVYAESAQERFDSGNLAYQRGRYKAALGHYHKLEEWNVEHPALYFNISNAYYQLGQYGYALLYIEKALKIRPAAEDYLANRRLILAKINAKNAKLKRRFRQVYGQDHGFVASLIRGVPTRLVVPLFLSVYVLFFVLISLAVAKPSPRKRWALRGAIAITLLATLVLGAVWGGQRYLRSSRHYGVIVSASADVYPNSLSRDRTYELYEGAKVQIVDTGHPKRIKVRLSEDSEGWVDRSHLKGI